jgi:hypothetical protein
VRCRWFVSVLRDGLLGFAGGGVGGVRVCLNLFDSQVGGLVERLSVVFSAYVERSSLMGAVHDSM